MDSIITMADHAVVIKTCIVEIKDIRSQPPIEGKRLHRLKWLIRERNWNQEQLRVKVAASKQVQIIRVA